jgi:hypothetical protein
MADNTHEIILALGDRLELRPNRKLAAAKLLHYSARGVAADFAVDLSVPELQLIREALLAAMLELGHMPADDELPE